jgi:hypothetical protein
MSRIVTYQGVELKSASRANRNPLMSGIGCSRRGRGFASISLIRYT